MKVNRRELQEGCILLEDIFSVSPTPIMTKKTILTLEHLDLLKAFLVEEVEVEEHLDSGERFSPAAVIEEEKRSDPLKPKPSGRATKASYKEAVKRFKEQFNQWQSGASINILGLQGILISLFNDYSKKPNELFRLHEKTTEEDYIFHHSVGVGLMSAYLAQKMKYPRKNCHEIGLAGMLLDCGMAKIPPHYLFKTKDLDPRIAQQLSKHPVFGYQMLKKDQTIDEGILLAVLQHHEREDGSGYPLGVKGNKVHPYAKIVMVVDAYHAMVSERHYRKQISPFTALEILNKDIAKFDPRSLLHLTQEVTHLFVGTKVTLSTSQMGEIIFIPNDSPTRPMIRLDEGQAIALSHQPSILIDKIH